MASQPRMGRSSSDAQTRPHSLLRGANVFLLLMLVVGSLITPAAPPLAQPLVDQISSDAAAQGAPQSAALPAPLAPTDSRILPADVLGMTEMLSERSANTATFQQADGRFTSIMADAPMHYRDVQGAWQIINPAFQPTAESYIIEQNAIRSRAGNREAWLSAESNEAVVMWQAKEVGVVDAGERWTSLAKATPDAAPYAQRSPDGRSINYPGGWSSPGISERLDSAPGSLEHSLVLNERPDVAGSPQFLELRATLKVLPGATLWANGAAVTAQTTTDGTLEIHDKNGATALVFDPVLAFEQANTAQTTAGSYTITPTVNAGEWTVAVRTDWSWWAAGGRQYPAVIDPTMHVITTTGYGTGLAWAANPIGFGAVNPDTQVGTFHYNSMVLGSYNKSGPYRGYMQFNSIPLMLSTKNISVSHAVIDITPSGGKMPYYSFPEGDFPDWEEQSIQQNATLYGLGQCPAQCNGFSLVTKPSDSFTWQSTIGNPTQLETKVLTIPPTKTGGKASTQSWNVTNQIRAWNTQVPRPANGPMFMLTLNTTCQQAFFEDDAAANVPACTRFVIPKGNVHLRIDFDALPLTYVGAGSNLLNSVGVPSYLKDIFEQNTTNHQYDLDDNGAAQWRAVAVRGNHRLNDPKPTSAKTGMRIVDYSDPNLPKVLTSDIAAQSADKTSFVLIDRHNLGSQIGSVNLKAEVTASDDNTFATDEDRNYRIEYTESAIWTPSYGTWLTKTLNFNSASLLRIGEFNLNKGDNVGLRVTVPTSATIDFGLLQPTVGSEPGKALVSGVDTSFGPGTANGVGGKLYTKPPFPASRTGTWGIVAINQGRPSSVPIRPNTPINYMVTVEILVCPAGSIPTAKWSACQPVRLASGDESSAQIRTVGTMTIYSEGGFTAGANWCTQNEGSGTPSVHSTAVPDRWFVVGQGSLCLNGTTLSTSADSGVGLAYRLIPDPTPNSDDWRGSTPPTLLYGDTLRLTPPVTATGAMSTNAQNRFMPTVNTRRNINPFAEYWGSVLNEPAGSHYIALSDMKAYGGGTVSASVVIDRADGAQPLTWNVPWSLYPTAVSSDVQATDALYQFDAVVTQNQTLLSPTSLSSLELRILANANNPIGKLLTLDARKLSTNIYAQQFHALKGKITQPVPLGGASKNVQVVVQPPGRARLPDNIESCNIGIQKTSCMDLRLDSYSWDNGEGDKSVKQWELPDVHIEDNLGTLALSRAGSTQIWSADHPNAAQAVDESFTFDTWGASVSIRDEECFPGDGISTVVNGMASIAMPMFGDDGSEGNGPTKPPSIAVGFRLCQSRLYSATLSLSIKPALIPVGASGLGLNFIAGTVLLNPDYTRIEFKLGFETVDGATLTDGVGVVTIDTRGMFSLEADATIIGILDAHLFLQVAWNPLDILLDASVKYGGDLITGSLHLHAWVGQGWQHKYSWLPDDDAAHFSGKIAATLKIPEGDIGDIGIAKLPPFDIVIGLQVSIGEFCTNPTCSKFDWGMSVAFTVAGFDIGLYVDSDGPEFIFGTDDHVLIDQFNGQPRPAATQALAQPPLPNQIFFPGQQQQWLKPAVKSPVDGWTAKTPAGAGCSTDTVSHTVTCPFAVKPGTGRALFMAGWQNGDLPVELIKPDATVITPANAAANGVTISISNTASVHEAMFGVTPVSGQTVASGQWKLRLRNIGQGLLPGITNNYQLMYAADPPAPVISWIAPATPGIAPNGSGIVSLDWQVLRNSVPVTPGLKLELAYEPVATKPITTDDYTGIMIASQLTASVGHYDWDTRGLASGEYAVVARVDDHFNGNGHVVAWTLGTVVISDTVAPPVPTIFSKIPVDDGLIVTWNRDLTTPDLAGYLVEYTIPNWDEGPQQLLKQRRVLPGASDSQSWQAVESLRLGGLLNGQPTNVCVRAYDASGNVSGCTPFIFGLPTTPRPQLGPPTVIRVSVVSAPAPLPIPMFQIDWSAPAAGGAAGYLLSYKPIGCLLPNVQRTATEGSSPIDVGNVLSYNLRGLTPGQLYHIAVRAYDSNKYLSAEVATTEMFVLPTDSNGDGIADQWATVYGITSASLDTDKDGLSNLQEFQKLSNPNRADSDGDGYYDKEEVLAGTGLCSPEHPDYHTRPKLTVIGKSALKFKLAINGGGVSAQRVSILNLGGDQLNWTATPSAAWIKLDKTAGINTDFLNITTDGLGLPPGVYTGQVTIVGDGSVLKGAPAAEEPETVVINVELTVLPKAQLAVFIPQVQR